MAKKWFACLLAVLLVLTLAACGKGEDKDSGKNKKTQGKKTEPTKITTTTGMFPVYYVTANPLNVRSAPRSNSTKLGELAYGTPVEILGTEGNWYRISYDGVRAYISAQYVSPEPPAEKIP